MPEGLAPGRQQPPRRFACRAGLGTGAVMPMPFGRAAASFALNACRVAALLASRRVRQPTDRKGLQVRFGDGTHSTVYRETVISGARPTEPVVLVVCFRLRRVRSAWAHTVFRWESELNTVLFAGFPGLVSKLWLCHDETGRYRGIYQWDGEVSAVDYVRTLWRALAAVSARESIRYEVVPGAHVDSFLTAGEPDGEARGEPGEWWRPTGVLRPYQPATAQSQNSSQVNPRGLTPDEREVRT